MKKQPKMVKKLIRWLKSLMPGYIDDPIIRTRIEEAKEQYNRSGKRYLLANKPDQALEAYNRKLNDFPEDGSLYLGRGQAHFELGNYDKAIEDCTLALRYGVGFAETKAEAYYWRSQAYSRKSAYVSSFNDAEHAANDLQRAMEVNPLFVNEDNGAKKEHRDDLRSRAREYYR